MVSCSTKLCLLWDFDFDQQMVICMYVYLFITLVLLVTLEFMTLIPVMLCRQEYDFPMYFPYVKHKAQRKRTSKTLNKRETQNENAFQISLLHLANNKRFLNTVTQIRPKDVQQVFFLK